MSHPPPLFSVADRFGTLELRLNALARPCLSTLSAKYPARPLSRQDIVGFHHEGMSHPKRQHAQSVIANSFTSTKPTSRSLQPRLVVHLPIASPTGQVLSPSGSLPEAKVSTENGLSNSGHLTIAIFAARDSTA